MVGTRATNTTVTPYSLGARFVMHFVLLGRLHQQKFPFWRALDVLSTIRYRLHVRLVVCGSWVVTKPTKQQK